MIIIPSYRESAGTTWLELEAKGHIDIDTSERTHITFYDISSAELKALVDTLLDEYIKAGEQTKKEG